jgi:hypothetical protein
MGLKANWAEAGRGNKREREREREQKMDCHYSWDKREWAGVKRRKERSF